MTFLESLLLSAMVVVSFYFWQWTGIGLRVAFHPHDVDIVDFLGGFFYCAFNEWLERKKP